MQGHFKHGLRNRLGTSVFVRPVTQAMRASAVVVAGACRALPCAISNDVVGVALEAGGSAHHCHQNGVDAVL